MQSAIGSCGSGYAISALSAFASRMLRRTVFGFSLLGPVDNPGSRPPTRRCSRSVVHSPATATAQSPRHARRFAHSFSSCEQRCNTYEVMDRLPRRIACVLCVAGCV